MAAPVFAGGILPSGEYDLCLTDLKMNKLACTMDIGEKFVVSGDTWKIGEDITGRLEDNVDFVRLYLTQGIDEVRIGDYTSEGGWLTDMKTRILIVDEPFDFDRWCVGFSPMPKWCK
jgi:hypothetical protein